MDGLVERKMREREEETLVDWYAEDGEGCLPPDILRLEGTRAEEGS